MSLEILDAEHLGPLRQGLANVLSTPTADLTYAQIVDGMPLASIYAEDHWFREGLPVMDHEELCPGVLEKTRALRSEFDVSSLPFQPQTLQAYQDTRPGSVAWKLRLLELVVIACHDIAVHLYQMDDGVHKHAEWSDWRAEKLARVPGDAHGRERAKCGPPTPFFTGLYMNSERFPNGLADVVGYWAEARIFGGVVLFDRGKNEKECNGIYLHFTKPTTLTPPTENQFETLIDFLISQNPDLTQCPLPIEATTENKWRWRPYEGMVNYHIFKYRHEIPEKRARTHCVIQPLDWPEMREERIAREEMRKKNAGEPFDEDVWEKLARIITPTSMFFYDFVGKLMLEMQPDERQRGRPPYFFDC